MKSLQRTAPMAKDKVTIEVQLSSDWWLDPPKFEFWVNEEKIEDGTIEERRDNNEYKSLKWEGELEQDSEHTLKIVYKGKNIKGHMKKQTVVDDNGKIIKDQILQLENVLLDDIELGYTAIKVGTYYQNDDDGYNPKATYTGKRSFGINGEWVLKFRTPTYMWLLENF